MPESLLCLNIATELEQDMVDWLLERDDVAGFTSMACSGHGEQHLLQSIAEHVAGKSRRIQMQVKLSSAVEASLLNDLAAEFGGADVMYWVLPLSGSGNLNK